MLIASLGEPSERAMGSWIAHAPSPAFAYLENPSPSGLRFGSRLAGIGVDCLRLAPQLWHKRHVLVTNPWLGVAAQIARVPDFAVTGIYAEPNTRSWRVLRQTIGERPVVATSAIESANWNRAGGRSRSVFWGGTFQIPHASPQDEFKIFIGGSSDRDATAIRGFLSEFRQDDPSASVVVADGSGPKTWLGQRAKIRWLPYVTQTDFLYELAGSSVSWLPLLNRARAAGHMVFAASLQAGVPVMARATGGLQEYLEAAGLAGYRTRPRLQDFRRAALDADREHLQRVWQESFSTDTYVRSVVRALRALGWVGLEN